MHAGSENISSDPLVVNAGSLTMTVDPAQGGRIISCCFGGRNMLLEASAVSGTENANNFGATFWPSPQSAWGWPPIAEIDSGRYSVVERSAQCLKLTSSRGVLLDNSPLSLTKTLVPVPAQHAIDITYLMTNLGNSVVKLSGWQIARVRAGGLTFFRLGDGGLSGDKLATATIDGVQWYAYDANVVVAQGQKTFADAAGWLAHIEDDLILVNSFPDVPKGAAAEGEAEVELYADPSHTYVELEPQGPLQTIEPGRAAEPWTVRWWLRRLPVGLEAKPGNAELVAFVENLIRS